MGCCWDRACRICCADSRGVFHHRHCLWRDLAAVWGEDPEQEGLVMNAVQDKMTWRQGLMLAIVMPPIVAGIFLAFAAIFDFDAFTRTAEDHTRCMKAATTGQEIQKCR